MKPKLLVCEFYVAEGWKCVRMVMQIGRGEIAELLVHGTSEEFQDYLLHKSGEGVLNAPL